MSGGWDASVLSLYLSSSRQKSFLNFTFSKLAILSTALIKQIIDTNALISYIRQLNKTDIIEKHSIAKVFAKTPISA